MTLQHMYWDQYKKWKRKLEHCFGCHRLKTI